MLADWETNTVLISDLLPQRHPEIVRRLEAALSKQEIPLTIVPGTADIWIRDAAPIQIADRLFTQFRYSPDYLRKGHKHRITGPEVFRKTKLAQRSKRSKLVIDGGNIVGTGSVVIVTNKVYTENPGRSRDEIRQELRQLLRVERLIIIPKEAYDYVGHSDGMARFVSDCHVVVNDYRRIDPPFAGKVEAMLAANRIDFTRIPYVPERHQLDGISSAVGNYANFLRVGNLLVVPAYGLPEDKVARKILANLLPAYRVVSLPCRDLAQHGGVLNCATWTIRQAKLEA